MLSRGFKTMIGVHVLVVNCQNHRINYVSTYLIRIISTHCVPYLRSNRKFKFKKYWGQTRIFLNWYYILENSRSICKIIIQIYLESIRKNCENAKDGHPWENLHPWENMSSGFPQSEISTSLLSYRDLLENWNFALSKSRYDTFQ